MWATSVIKNFLTTPSTIISTQFYSRYSDYMGPLLSDLSADLTHLWVSNNPATAAGTGDSIRFIYYNGANFAVKSTVNMLTSLPLLRDKLCPYINNLLMIKNFLPPD